MPPANASQSNDESVHRMPRPLKVCPFKRESLKRLADNVTKRDGSHTWINFLHTEPCNSHAPDTPVPVSFNSVFVQAYLLQSQLFFKPPLLVCGLAKVVKMKWTP